MLGLILMPLLDPSNIIPSGVGSSGLGIIKKGG